MKKYLFFRKKYPKFIYQNFDWQISGKNLEISFDFSIEPEFHFKPKLIIQNVRKSQIKRVGERLFDNLVFNLGLIEMLSYWKATCSKEIKIEAGNLNKEQSRWWKNLILKGMGQYFFENKIDFREKNFIEIKTEEKKYAIAENLPLKDEVLIPMGGGKDSILAYEILKNTGKKLIFFSLNPNETIRRLIKISGQKNYIFVKRKFDQKLFRLNKKGFLNGHTPFTAYLSFLSVLIAALLGTKYIAFSNERSSEEGNLRYLRKIINHQYSKTFEFEKNFREYTKKYLIKNVEYFSFLRPLYEIQIVKLFSNYSRYFDSFLSCNKAYKIKKPFKKWCGKCPKCLFIFASLYPFVGERAIEIFGKNLFKEKKLIPLMLRLIGKRKFKPFECIGTMKESKIAFYLSLKKYKKEGIKKLPPLLDYFEKKILPKEKNLENLSKNLLNSWQERNFLPKSFKKRLKSMYFQNISVS
jgi:hypothetical protein